MDGVLSRKELDHFMLLSEGAMQPKVSVDYVHIWCGSLGAHSDVVEMMELKVVMLVSVYYSWLCICTSLSQTERTRRCCGVI